MAVVRRAESRFRHDLGHRLFRRLAFQDVADFDQVAGKGERTDVVDDFMQAVDQQQEEVRDFRHRARDVADRYDLRLVAMSALPGGEERYAAPGGVAADGAADVEMAAA